jgi:hypothetical protein
MLADMMTKTPAAIIAAMTIGLAGPAHADDAAVNLPVTNGVRAELIQAGASLTGRPASEFRELRPGYTYYAYDPNPVNTYYWAAAQLWNPTTQEAGFQLQDQNSYMVFRKGAQPGTTWLPIAVGYGPIRAGKEPCPVPQSVRDVWQWPAGTCYPGKN